MVGYRFISPYTYSDEYSLILGIYTDGSVGSHWVNLKGGVQ